MDPITSYSHTPLGTGEPAQKPSEGSQPMATATGISFLPCASQEVTWWPICWARHIKIGILSRHARIGDEVAPAVHPVPVRHRQLGEIDILAGDDVLLDRAARDDLGWDRALENGAADLDQLARMRVGRQAEHDGDAPIVVEGGAEHAPA